MQCNGFEPIMEFLKTTLPSLGIIQMERVFNQVFTLDISKQLHAFEVEYHVLQEEMIFSPQKTEKAYQNLRRQNMELLEQLQVRILALFSFCVYPYVIMHCRALLTPLYGVGHVWAPSPYWC